MTDSDSEKVSYLKKLRKKTAATMGSWRVKVMKGMGKAL